MINRLSFYIPFYIDVHTMESKIVWEHMNGGCALRLSEVLALIAQGIAGEQWIFQSIDQSGFIEHTYSSEIERWFGGFILVVNGKIETMQKSIRETMQWFIYQQHRTPAWRCTWDEVTIGYQDNNFGIQLIPICERFWRHHSSRKTYKFNNIQDYFIQSFEDFKYISTVNTKELV
jgi:hypothetical protein